MKRFLFLIIFGFYIDQGFSVEIVPLKNALKATLGPVKAAAKKNMTQGGEKFEVYYDKNAPKKFAVVQRRIYPPNCTHTWVIGLDSSATVKDIRIVEYSCPHAKPATTPSYFEQYIGKGPADAGSLKGSISTVAKATGTCDLTTDAVIMSIKGVTDAKKSL